MQPIQSDFGDSYTGSHHLVPSYLPADRERVCCTCDTPADGLG